MQHPAPFSSALRLGLVCAALLLAACDAKSPAALIASGKDFAAKRDYPAAIIQFKAALQLDLTSNEARVQLGKALLDSGDPTAATVELTRALEGKAPTNEVLPSLAAALVQSVSYKKLVTAYGETVLQDRQAQADLKTQVAMAWAALGDRARSEAAIAAALSAVPGHASASILNARMLAGQGKFDEAVALVDEVLSKEQANPEAWLLRGELLNFHKRDAKAAEAAFQRAIASRNGFIAAHSAVIALRLRQRDVDGAKAQAEKLRQVAPNHPHMVLVDAQLAYASGQHGRARELAQALLRVYPDHEDALVLAGAAESKLGSPVQASAHLNKVLNLSPGLDGARLNLAEVEIKLGQYTKALATLKPLLTSQPPLPGAFALAGDAELRLGNAVVAERHFTQAARLDPADVRLQTAAAVSRMSTGNAAQGLSELEAIAKASKETYADEALFAARVKRREFDAALQVLDGLERKASAKAAHHEMRGRVHLARKDFRAARGALEQALQLDPALYAAVASLAYLDLLENKAAQAMQRIQAVVAADPRNTVALVALAEMKARNGAPVVEVKKLFADAVAASPSDPEPRLKLIEFNLRKRQYKDALAAAQDALAALPGNVRILEAAAHAQTTAGNLEQAANTYRRLAAAIPDSAVPYLRLGEVYSVSGLRDQALAAISKALEIAPDLAEAQVALINALLSSGRPTSALEYAVRRKQAKPGQPSGYSLEALYHARRNDNNAALAALREGALRTNNSELAGKYFSLLLKTGRTADADRFGAGWIKQHPEDAAFEYLLSVADIARGDLRTAESRLRRVVAAYPNNVLALNNLAWVLVTSGRGGALPYAQRAVDLEPDRPELMDTLALALEADKQLGPALDMQKRAVEFAPDNHGLRLGLARLALASGDRSLARDELKRLQALGSTFPQQAAVEKLLHSL
jgi:putative PEP-CTERM system TPR-repeat lipoprotein